MLMLLGVFSIISYLITLIALSYVIDMIGVITIFGAVFTALITFAYLTIEDIKETARKKRRKQ